MMRKTWTWLIAALVAVVSASCSRRSCVTPYIRAIQIYRSTSHPDTSATLTSYSKGGNFNNLQGSYIYLLDTSQSYLSIPIPQGIQAYDYDWRLVMHPSETTFSITGINHDSSHESRSWLAMGEDKGCANTLHYMVNGAENSESPDIDNNGSAYVTLYFSYP